MKRLMTRARRFRRNDEGSVLVEAVMVLPTMFWAVLAMFVYWDAYRSINTVQKAAYTVSDTISRLRTDVDGTYLSGLNTVMNYLLDAGQTARMRVTSVTWDAYEDRFEVLWSYSPGAAMAALDTDTLQPYASLIPAMTDGDTVVVVEAAVDYAPAFNVGLADTTIEQFVVTRPRSGRVCFVDTDCF